MKISYKVLKSYKKDIKNAEELAKDLVMHTAEVEDIHSQKKDFENIVYWKIKSVENHTDADSLRVCMVDIWEENDTQIVCGWSNLEVWQAVAVAKIWAVVSWHGTETITMKKTAIRWVESNGMICASEEIGLKDMFPANDEKEIMDLSSIEAKTGTPLAELLWKDDEILEVDNKAINHRPDLFSHIWIIREVFAINNENFDYKYESFDFSSLDKLSLKNDITNLVSRYLAVRVENVSNIKSPDYIKQVISSAEIDSKWLLIDLSNYSLYLYGQPTHLFDADKISWNITIRLANSGEKFVALNDKEYELSSEDIVIADDEKILALWGIIWWKSSSVDDNTKNVIIESAHFDQATIRKTWKRLWVRTDSLNVFEKDLVNEMQTYWAALIINEINKNITDSKVVSFEDLYPNKQEVKEIDFDLDYINRLIWKNYSKEEVLSILKNLWIELENDKLIIPFWRKDLSYKSDIAEEIARISGYNNIESTIPEINMWAVIQNNTYKIKKETKDFFTSIGYYDLFTYSFVNKELMEKSLSTIDNLVEMKNALSEELTHLRWSLIPNLLLSLEKNIKEFEELNLFEIEKVFTRKENEVIENYNLSWVSLIDKDIAYYDIQNTISNFFNKVWVSKFFFEKPKNIPWYAHSWRTSRIVIRWKDVWFVWEIHPKVQNNFWINSRIWFFEINIDLLVDALFWIVKAKDISSFQENDFDLNFLVDKENSASKLKTSIEKTDTKIITKVEVFDIYENEEKMPWKRSITFKIYIQSMDKTLDDKEKWELIEKIIKNVNKVWWELR